MDFKIMKVKSLPHEIEQKGLEKEVYVELGIQKYVKLANKIHGIYTVGSCEGHKYLGDHVFNDNSKKTLGWIQLYKLDRNDSNIKKLLRLLTEMDTESEKSENHEAKIVCIIDPFSGVVPMDYNKVFISEYMWNKYLDNRNKYTLMGINELVILAPDGKVIGNYKNVYNSALLKSRLIMREADMEAFI